MAMDEMDLDRSEPNHYYSTEVEDQAVQWFKKMSDKEVSEADRRAFQAWMRQDRAHGVAYEDLTAFWNNPLFERALREKKDQMPEVVDKGAQPRRCSVADLAARRKSRTERRGASAFFNLKAFGAIAASFVFAAFVLITAVMEPQGQIQKMYYYTDVGETRTLTLSDGSTVYLNTDTRMNVAFDDDTRTIKLSRGEAFFDVVRDGRPFLVEGGTGLVTVLGTAFDVKVNASEMEVSVERGRVAVSPRREPSQRREITALGRLAIVDHRLGTVTQWSQAEGVADWRDGWLDYREKALGDVIVQLDRYYKGSLRLDGAVSSELPVTGRFQIKDIHAAIDFLADLMKLKVSTSKNGDIILTSSHKAGQSPTLQTSL